jgi:Family of unknown function (DUF6527)
MGNNPIKRFIKWLKRRKPDRIYSKVIILSSMADIPKFLGKNIFIIEREKSKRWAIFDCPGGHGHRIEVNLMFSKIPYWRIDIKFEKVSLWPSVWVESEDCNDHFWLKENGAYLVNF